MRFTTRVGLSAVAALALTACDRTPAGPDAVDVSTVDGSPQVSRPPVPPANPATEKGPVPFVWSPDRGIEEIYLPSDAIAGHAAAINSSGEVAGWYQPSGAGSRAFTWSRTRGLHVLPAPSGMEGLAGAVDINDRGEVLGTMSFAWAPTINFVWSAGRGFRTIRPPDGDILADAINNNGDVVGIHLDQYEHAPAPLVEYRGFIWSEERGFQKLPPLGEFELTALTDINDAGAMVGFANTRRSNDGIRGVGPLLRWAPGARDPVEIVPAPSPNGCDNWWDESLNAGCADVTAVNIHGEAVGSLGGRAFRSVPGKPPVYLSSSEGRASFATAINDAGLVVGYTISNPGFGAVIRAFVWAPDGSVMRPPSLPGRRATYATDINNLGQVVGIAR